MPDLFGAPGSRGSYLAGDSYLERYSSWLAFPTVAQGRTTALGALGGWLDPDVDVYGPIAFSAGRVYFAAGSFEPEDFPDGLVDPHGNMVREVREETGLDISGARRGERHHALATERGTVIFRRYFLDENADEIASRIRDFVAGEAEPEIEEPIVIRHAGDLPDGLMPHMPTLIEWHFSESESGRAATLVSPAS